MTQKFSLPIVVGVVGHRQISGESRKTLEHSFRIALTEILVRHPHSEVIVATGLAEGADRLAAHIALELGCTLFALEPMPSDDYERDFPNSVAEFRALKERAALRHSFQKISPETNLSEPAARDLQYGLLSRYLALNSHYLIAFWDGVETDLEGGTGSTVRYRMGAEIPIETNEAINNQLGLSSDWTAPHETGPVMHILTSRDMGGDFPGVTGSVTTLVPDWCRDVEGKDSLFDQIFSRQDEFNKRLKRYAWIFRRLQRKSRFQLGDVADSHLSSAFAYGDAMANVYRSLSTISLYLIVVLTLLAVFFYATFSDGVLLSPATAVSGYALTMVVAWGLFSLVLAPRNWQDRSLEYRALAEALRIQHYWWHSDIQANVADHFLRMQRDELTWIRFALRGCHCRALGSSSSPKDDIEYAVNWVEGQATYFHKAGARDEARLEGMKRLSATLMVGTLIPIAAILASLWGTIQLSAITLSWFVFLSGLGPALVAIMGYVAGTLNLEGHASQYERMWHTFRSAASLLARLEESPARRRILLTLGKEALLENGEWVSAHKLRRIEPSI